MSAEREDVGPATTPDGVLSDEQRLAIWRAVAPGCDGLKVTREVGPYDVTELTPLAQRLFAAIEQEGRKAP